MKSANSIKKVKRYYDQEAKHYIDMYKKGYAKYPANLIRLNILLRLLKARKARKVLDIGCGSCGPMIRLLKEGFEVHGVDFSREMVRRGKEELLKAGFEPRLISWGDIEDGSTLPRGKYDAIIASGVFPHLLNEHRAMLNIRKRLKRNGFVFIEFRNDLFAAYTLNKYSLDFFLNSLIDIKSLDSNVRKALVEFYSERLKADKPETPGGKKLSYTDIMAKFHNPLKIGKSIFEPSGFSIKNIHFYHYHALPPVFEKKYPEIFRRLSLGMEEANDWRGYFMASAYVVEAVKS